MKANVNDLIPRLSTEKDDVMRKQLELCHFGTRQRLTQVLINTKDLSQRSFK